MENLLIGVIAGLLVLLASVASVELGISVALIEITFGVVAGNFLSLTSPPWMDFLASFGSILLTFLAGAEVDPRVMQEKFKESLLIGSVSFAAPFLGAWLFCAWVLGWSSAAAQIAGVALSTTSLAVVYAVLVEAGILDQAQFSVLVTVVVASAVIPTIIAQRWFHPAKAPHVARARPAGARR